MTAFNGIVSLIKKSDTRFKLHFNIENKEINNKISLNHDILNLITDFKQSGYFNTTALI